MGSEMAAEFIYDQGVYYPVAPDCYEVYCTARNEKPGEWDDRRSFLGLNSQDINYSGLQNESLSYVYYSPNYGYSHSSFNPYNPYIPGAVMDIDRSNLTAQQYFTNQSYPQPTSSPAFMPVVVPSNADMVPYVPSVPPFLGTVPSFSSSCNYVGPTFTSPLASGMKTHGPVKVVTENPSFEFPKVIPAIISDEPVVNAQQRKQSTVHGAMQDGSLPQTIENMHSAGLLFSRGRVQSAQNSSKSNFAAKNNYMNYGSSFTPVEKLNPKFSALSQGARYRNPNLPNELNRGPRTTRAKDQGASITAISYTSKLNGNNLYKTMTIDPDQYDGTNFQAAYPNAKFFVIKSYNEDDVHKSIKYNVWSSTPNGNKKLDCAYLDAQNLSGGEREKCPVLLFFSVNASGHFCGVAEMIGRVDFENDMDFWQQDQWSGSFPIKWHIIKDVANSSMRHIILDNNEDRPVTHSRDTQEIAYAPGVTLLNIFKNSSLKDSILDDFMYYEELEKRKHQEKVKLPRRNYGSTDLIPTFVPANILGSRIIQSVPSNILKSDSVSNQLPEDHTNQLNGVLPVANKKDQVGSVGQCLQVDMSQKSYAFTQPLNENNSQLIDKVEQAMEDRREPNNKIIESDSAVGQSLDVVAKVENCNLILPRQSLAQPLPIAVIHSSESNKNQQSTGGHHRNADEKQLNRTVVKSQKLHGRAYRPVQINEGQSNCNCVCPPSDTDQLKCVIPSPLVVDGKGGTGKSSADYSATHALRIEHGNPIDQAILLPKLHDNANTKPSRAPLVNSIARSSAAGLDNSRTSQTVTIGSVQIQVKGLDEYSGTSIIKRFQMDQGAAVEKKN